MPTARHIVVLLHDFSLGGTERIAIRLANAWARAGREVTLVCGQDAGPLRPFISDGVTVREVAPPVPRGRGARRRLAVAVAQLIDHLAPDLVFVPGNYHLPVADALARRAHRPALVAKLSNPLLRPDRGRVRQWLFDRTTARRLARFDAVIAMSAALARDAARLIDAKHILEVPNPSLDDDFAPPLAIPRDSTQILAAGRLAPQKNFALALEALAALRTPGATLTILGDGPERPMLEDLAARLGCAERCRFPGYVPDTRPWLDEARVVLLTSDFEGYPGVAVEALAAGRPVVATDCSPAISEVIADPAHGAIVPRGDKYALADALDRILGAPPPDTATFAALADKHRLTPVAHAYLGVFDGTVEKA